MVEKIKEILRKNRLKTQLGYFLTAYVLFAITVLASVSWYGTYGKSHRIVSAIYDEENIAYFSDFVHEVESYKDIPEWVYSNMDFIKNGTFTRYGSMFNILRFGNQVPRLMFESHKGRCEEFSIIAGSIAVAQGYDVRLVANLRPGDHAWIEVSINGSWIHLDPSEKVVDDPFFYSRHNRTLGKVIAFTTNTHEDVSRKYTKTPP